MGAKASAVDEKNDMANNASEPRALMISEDSVQLGKIGPLRNRSRSLDGYVGIPYSSGGPRSEKYIIPWN